jgi:uncharacterized membrane protein (DUF485 family)
MDQHIQMLEMIARQRMRLSLVLTAVLFVAQASFFYMIGFQQSFMGMRLVPGLSVGLFCALTLFPLIWVLVAIYVRWSNTHYDQTVAQLRTTFHQGGTRR